MARLDGTWRVERVSGAVPPGLRKRIEGASGATLVGPLPVPFRLEGLTIRYRPPLHLFVDVLEPDGDGFLGRGTFLGRDYCRFRLVRLS